MLKRHDQWIAHHGRVYKDVEEKAMRFQIFKDNLQRIETFNGGLEKGYKLAVNQFADLTNEEFRATRNGYKRQSPQARSTSSIASFRYANVSVVPATIDWRKKGAVTPIKDQGQCGKHHIDYPRGPNPFVALLRIYFCVKQDVAGHFQQWQRWKGSTNSQTVS